jgi:predicted Zn-dependent protease
MRVTFLCNVLVLAFLVSSQAHAIDESQQRSRLLFEAQQGEEMMLRQGLFYGDPALDAYLQSIIDRLYPEKTGRFHVHAIRDTEFNAFAVADGSIFVNIGLLLRVDDEAQLATVLGHEGGHVVGDHMYLQMRSAKTRLATGIFLGAGLGELLAASSLAGFSREHERDADRIGFDRMVHVGYDPAAGSEIWARMERELTVRKIKEPAYFFADHPKVVERQRNLAEFALQAPPGGERDRERFLEATAHARLDALDAVWKRNDGKLLVLLLESENLLPTLPKHCRFYLGEGYRLRNDPGDLAKAVEQLQLTLTEAPEFAPTWNSLGRVYLHQGDKTHALQHFRKYLELEPSGSDAGYARLYVDQLQKETP